MENLRRLVCFFFLAVNAFLVGMQILTAYSSFLHPAFHPKASCLGLAFPFFLVVNACFLVAWLLIHYRYAALSLLGFLICLPALRTFIPLNGSTEKVPEGCIKVLSYNIMGFDGMRKKNGKNPILTYLAESGADIICLQEYQASTKSAYLTHRDIRRALKAYRYVSILQTRGGSNRLACFSKFPILSAKPVRYASSYNGSVVYTLKVHGEPITLINNHLESNKLTKEDRGIYEDLLDRPDAQKVRTGMRQLVGKLAEASAIRAVQADSVAACVARSPHPTVVVCGDFNDVCLSYTHRQLTQQLHDAFAESGHGLGVSYNQNRFYFRIDHILLSSNLKSYQCTVDQRIKASDHYPIWCYIQKKS